jgi:hypothetical protein
MKTLDVRVISLGEPTALLERARRLFPSASVGVRRGIDVRGASVRSLVESGMITHGAAHVLRHGRKWHHELGSKGGIGLAHAVRLALQEDVTRPLLLFEDDCVIRDAAALVREVETLCAHTASFDVAVLGCQLWDRARADRSVPFLRPPWVQLRGGRFFMMQCVLYSPAGRQRLAAHLAAHPLDMQIDALLSALADQGTLRVLAHVSAALTRQSLHVSAIQETLGTCALCMVHPFALKTFNPAVALVAVAAACAALRRRSC